MLQVTVSKNFELACKNFILAYAHVISTTFSISFSEQGLLLPAKLSVFFSAILEVLKSSIFFIFSPFK